MAGRCLSCRTCPSAPTPEPRRSRDALPCRPGFLGLEPRAVHARARCHRPSLPRTNVPCGADDANDLAVDDAHPAPRDDDALDDAVAELLFVVVPLPVAVVDAADRRVPPVDDADAVGRVDVRTRPDEHVAPTRRRLALGERARAPHTARVRLLEAHVAEVRARAVDDAADAPAALSAERAEVVHLLEERGKVFRLGDRHLVAQLEQALVVERPAPRGRHVGARRRVERPLNRREQLELLAHDVASPRDRPRARGRLRGGETGFGDGIWVTVKRSMCGCPSLDASQNGGDERPPSAG